MPTKAAVRYRETLRREYRASALKCEPEDLQEVAVQLQADSAILEGDGRTSMAARLRICAAFLMVRHEAEERDH